MSSVLQSAGGFITAGVRRERLKFWGIQSGASLLDQGLTSGAGFVMNLFLARWLTTVEYGAFAVAFATLLFVSGFHNVLLLEPTSVYGPASHASDILSYFRAQLKIHFLLTSVLSLLLIVTALTMSKLGIHRELISATLASGVAFPLILVLWLVRRMCYAVHRAAIAVWASAGYFVLLLAGLFTMHWMGWMNPALAMLLMAAASVTAILIPLCKLDMLSIRGNTSLPWKQVLRENWTYGRWLVASTTLFALTSQTQTYLAAAMLGLGAAGVLRAMQMPSLVMTQVVSALSLLLLPMMAREYGLGHIDRLRKKAVISSIVLATLALAYAAILKVFAGPTERLMYGGKFSSSAWLIPILALVPVCTGFGTGFSMAVRASRQPHLDLLANAISALVGLVTALGLIKIWGLGGAGISLVAGYAAYAGAFFWAFLRWTKKSVVMDPSANCA